MATNSQAFPWTRAVDPAGLAAFRILFGLTMTAAVVRFVAKGWVDELLVAPAHHFTYLGFDWVKPWPAPFMHVHFAVMGLAAFTLTLGWFTRSSAAVFCALFSYAELIDKATYLNHYYLVSLLSLLLVFVPSNAVWSLDARRRGAALGVRASAYWLLRAQVAIVYVFAGLAKLDTDWLLRAEPLKTWLRARLEAPALMGLTDQAWLPYAMSWTGAAFDLLVVPLLFWRRTRPFAFAAALLFHGAIWLLFPIGVFSFVMLVAVTVFFEPNWPRRALARLVPALAGFAPGELHAPRRAFVWAAGLYLAVQVLVPLRGLAYPGKLNWTEQGFRFAWRVMLIEKSGQVEYDVVTELPKRRFRVFPREELTPLQLRMMSTQPDMIQEYAQRLRERFRARGYEGVRVHADAWVAFNGRRSRRLIDPRVDLAAAPRSLAPKAWILPLEPPVPHAEEMAVSSALTGLTRPPGARY